MMELVGEGESREIMVEELFNFMRESVLINFRNSVMDEDFISRRLDEERTRTK
jgi:hypothetical protein